MLICNRFKILLKMRVLDDKFWIYIFFFLCMYTFIKQKSWVFQKWTFLKMSKNQKLKKVLFLQFFFNKIFTFKIRLQLCFDKKQNKKVKKTKNPKTKKVQNKITHFFFFLHSCVIKKRIFQRLNPVFLSILIGDRNRENTITQISRSV